MFLTGSLTGTKTYYNNFIYTLLLTAHHNLYFQTAVLFLKPFILYYHRYLKKKYVCYQIF